MKNDDDDFIGTMLGYILIVMFVLSNVVIQYVATEDFVRCCAMLGLYIIVSFIMFLTLD